MGHYSRMTLRHYNIVCYLITFATLCTAFAGLNFALGQE
jgi:hypothetical protein